MTTLVVGLWIAVAGKSAGWKPVAGSALGLEAKVEALLQKMTLEEKVAMCVGGGGSQFKGVPRLGVPDMICTDGPRGPHSPTAFPVGVAFGSTWDPDLMQRAALVMGQETRAAGASMLLGPGINILRDPLGGRFFEYYSEDPYLTGELAVGFVKGVQSQNVATCLKHFACNNREENRNNYMSMVGPRALQEIYLPAFRAATQRGPAWAVMTSANGVNGDFVSDSKALLNDTLKGQWGFDGMVLTDWLGTRSTAKAALAGLDVSMPYDPNSLFGQPLLAAVANGQVPTSVVDEKARRVLRTMGRVGLLDGVPPRAGGLAGTPEHFALSKEVAEGSLVLLKNQNKTLPLDRARLKNVLVVGPNANQRFCLVGLGGSSWQESPYEVTPLEGIKRTLGPRANVKYISTEDIGGFEALTAQFLSKQNGLSGFKAQYFRDGEGSPAVERTEPQLSFLWEMRSPDVAKLAPRRFRAKFTGEILAPVSGTYTLRITAGAGSAWVYVDQEGGAPLAFADSDRGVPSALFNVQLVAGKPFYLRVEYSKSSGDAACRLDWARPSDSASRAGALAKLAAQAKAADAVLVFAGIDHSLDSEGRDRTDMHFPEAQTALIRAVAAANPRTVVTLINGSPLELGPWLKQVPAVLEAWYGGMEAGTAIADVLFGSVNPSGKLPFSWPRRLADSPSHALGRQNLERVDYLEDVFVGYRYFDSRGVDPQFPFGFGLSYTKFAFNSLSVKREGDKVVASFLVKNVGAIAGAEVAQVYVHSPKSGVVRPVHELKGFRKVFLPPGESRRVTVDLSHQDFAYYNAARGAWVVPPGEYRIEVGSSSRDIKLSGSLRW